MKEKSEKVFVKILGLVTARGGSKGIPRKNVKFLCGKPLLVYTLEAARAAGVFDRIILTTDDEEIAAAGKKFGAEVPFLRPKDLAMDDTPTLPVLIHAVSYLRDKENYNPDFVMILQPTSPFRTARHIREAVRLILKTGADSVVGVREIPEEFNPARAMTVSADGFIRLWNGQPVKNRIPRRQDLPRSYASNTAIYLFKTRLLFGVEPNFFGEKVAPCVMDESSSLDINTPADWREAERRIFPTKDK